MSVESFNTHLEQLEAVLTLLVTDFQDGPVADLNTWYDRVVDDLYDFEDQVEAIIDARLGLNEDTFEDQEVEENVMEETVDETAQLYETDDSDFEEDSEEDMDVDEDFSDVGSSHINPVVSTADNSPKNITVNINLK